MGQFRGAVMQQGHGDATEANITVHPDHIEAQTIAGELHKLSYAGMVFEANDTPDGALICRDTRTGLTILCHDPGFMPALTKCAGRSLRKALAPNSRRLVRQQILRAVLGLVAAAAAITLLWGTPRWVRYGLRSVARVTPMDVDTRLGRAWLQNLDLGSRVLVANPWQADLDALVARLDAAHPLPHGYSVIVIDAPEEDAWALPGGPLIFKSGLLRRLAGPDAMAALVAHEMGHVGQRHLMQRLSQTLGVTTTVQFFFGDTDAVMRTPPGQLQLDVLLRPEDETEADHVALTLLAQAGVDPQGLIDLVTTLAADAHAKMPVPWLQRGPEVAKRLADLRRRVRRRPGPAHGGQPAVPSSPTPR